MDGPDYRFFLLIAIGIEALVKVASAVEQADSHHGHFEVSGGTDGVSRQGVAQAPAVSWDDGLQGNLPW